MGLVAILGILETAGSKSLAFGGHRRYHKGVKCVEIILIDDSFEKGIIAGLHGYIYTIFGLEASHPSFPRASS